MNRCRYSPLLLLLLLALIFGGLPAASQYLYGLTVVEGHGKELQMPVIMYATRWCPYCHQARAYFKRHSVNYIEYDIEASEENLARFRALNGAGVPLIVVGEKRMQGFHPRRFDDLLKQ